jgi:hypothetical protein
MQRKISHSQATLDTSNKRANCKRDESVEIDTLLESMGILKVKEKSQRYPAGAN